jgi:hypothetical protein
VPPLWARWVLSIAVGLAVLATIVIAVDRAGPEGVASESGTEAEVNRIADVAIAEDQAPHLAVLAADSTPVSALERAIAHDVRQRIADEQMVGPLQSVTCKPNGVGSAGRVPYRCTIRSAGIAYPFVGVADERRHRLAWCKVDPLPSSEAGMEVPVSAVCQA